jgi:hypothetical protein
MIPSGCTIIDNIFYYSATVCSSVSRDIFYLKPIGWLMLLLIVILFYFLQSRLWIDEGETRW